MSASEDYETLIHVSEQPTEGGRWIATSADIPGLCVFAPDLETLRTRVPLAVRALRTFAAA